MSAQFYRFQIFVTKNIKDLRDSRSIVGAAYLRDGHRVYTIKLWMFPAQKFYLMPDQSDQMKMVLFTREPKKDQSIGKGKYFWNAIGSGVVDPQREVVRLEFDLFDKPIYMSIFPAKPHELPPQFEAEVMDAS